MTVDLTASYDACRLSDICQDDDVFWLEPRSAKRVSTGSWGRKALLNLTTSIGLGACFSVAATGVATAPAAAAGQHLAPALETQIKLPVPADIDLTGTTAPQPIKFQINHNAAPAKAAKANDPLDAIKPVPAADLSNLRRDIIRSMPLTSAPASEGSEDEAGESDSGNYLQFEEMRVPRWIVDAVLRASETTGVDPVYMMALADKESSFIPSNKASTSSAQGLYQFITSTWLEVVRTFGPKHGLTAEAEAIQPANGQLTVEDEAMREHILGLRQNPYLSALMAAEMKKRDSARIENKLGRKITRSEFYLAHFFGADSAGKFMALVDGKPKQNAPRVLPAAARANKNLFFAKAGRKTRQLTVAEVYNKIDSMIDKRLSRYEGVTVMAMSEEDKF